MIENRDRLYRGSKRSNINDGELTESRDRVTARSETRGRSGCSDILSADFLSPFFGFSTQKSIRAKKHKTRSKRVNFTFSQSDWRRVRYNFLFLKTMLKWAFYRTLHARFSPMFFSEQIIRCKGVEFFSPLVNQKLGDVLDLSILEEFDLSPNHMLFFFLFFSMLFIFNVFPYVIEHEICLKIILNHSLLS